MQFDEWKAAVGHLLKHESATVTVDRIEEDYLRMSFLDGDTPQRFVTRAEISRHLKPRPGSPARSRKSADDLAGTLAVLAGLHASDALTDEEFAAAKASVLTNSRQGSYSISRDSLDERAHPSSDLIAGMWTLYVLGVVFYVLAVLTQDAVRGVMFGLSFALDVPAIVIAFILVCREHPTDKINGWVKLGLEFIGCVGGFVAALTSGAHYW